jgi:hypothetical protein
MIGRDRSLPRRSVIWSSVIVILLVLNFLTVSNVCLDPQWTTDGATYGDSFSPVRLPLTAQRILGLLSPVTLFPLGPIIRDGYVTRWRRWTGDVARVVIPYRNPTACFASFAVFNSLAWALFLATLEWSARRFSRARSRYAGRRREGSAG